MGDLVALVLRNNIEIFIIMLAFQKMGAIGMPLGYLNKKEQYESVFKKAKPKCIIAEDYQIKQSKDEMVYVLDEIDQALNDLNMSIIKIRKNQKCSRFNYYDNLEEYEFCSKFYESKSVGSDDLGYIFTTSGTSGNPNPKLVMHNYNFALAHYITGKNWYKVKKIKYTIHQQIVIGRCRVGICQLFF